MPAGLIEARILSQCLVRFIAGDLGECLVDRYNAALDVGDDNGFGCVVKNRGGQTLLFLGFLVFTEILNRHHADCPALIFNGLRPDLDGNFRTVFLMMKIS